MNEDFFDNNDGFMSSPNTYVTQQKINSTTKKRKAPLFIIGGIILLIAIIGSVAAFLFISKNEKYSKAEKATNDIITIFQQSDLSEATDYAFPAWIDFYEEHNFNAEAFFQLARNCFLTPEFTPIDYSIESVKSWDSENFYSRNEKLKSYSSYMEPTDFVEVEVVLSYEDQTSHIYFDYVFCDEEPYLFMVEESGYNLDFSNYTFSNTVSADDVSDLLESEPIVISGESVGEETSLNGYSIVVPANWKSDVENLLFSSSNEQTDITITTDSTFSYGAEDFFKSLINGFEQSGLSTTKFARLTTDNLTGYYMELHRIYNANIGDTFFPLQMTIMIYPKDGVAYAVFVNNYDPKSYSYEEGLKAAASFKFE